MLAVRSRTWVAAAPGDLAITRFSFQRTFALIGSACVVGWFVVSVFRRGDAPLSHVLMFVGALAAIQVAVYVGATHHLALPRRALRDRLETVGATERRPWVLTRDHSSVMLLMSALEARDAATARHSERVADYSVRIARQLRLQPGRVAVMEIAGLLHDIGKIGIDDAILRKPGALTAMERREMARHVELGVQMVACCSDLAEIVPMVRHHHTAYASAEQPPLGAAILAVADAFDAMTSERSYHHPLSYTAALSELRSCAGSQFHPLVVDGLRQALGGVALRNAS